MPAPTLDDEAIRRIRDVIALLIRTPAMAEPVVAHDTFVLERLYPAAPERLFAAFATARAKRIWFAEDANVDVEAFEMDFRIGGVETARCRFEPGGPLEGLILSIDGTYVDISPSKRIVTASTMTLDGRRISASLTTLTLSPTTKGTALTCAHQGAFFEGGDSPKMQEAGWRRRLDQLARALADEGPELVKVA